MKKEPQYVYCGINKKRYIVTSSICFSMHIIYVFACRLSHWPAPTHGAKKAGVRKHRLKAAPTLRMPILNVNLIRTGKAGARFPLPGLGSTFFPARLGQQIPGLIVGRVLFQSQTQQGQGVHIVAGPHKDRSQVAGDERGFARQVRIKGQSLERGGPGGFEILALQIGHAQIVVQIFVVGATRALRYSSAASRHLLAQAAQQECPRG